MSFKQKVEENVALFLLGTLFIGFTFGLAAYKGVLEIAGLTTVPKGIEITSAPSSGWESNARKSGWIPQNECPGFPISIKLASPGNESHVEYSEIGGPKIYTDVVVQSTRPVLPPADIGIVFNEEGKPNYHVTFPYLKLNDSRTIFRDEQFIQLPFRSQVPAKLNVWALATTDKRAVGSVYSNLQQIIDTAPGLVLSDKVVITLEQKVK